MRHDGTRENTGVLWEYVERHGRPAAAYTDRAAMFAIPPRPEKAKSSGNRPTG